MSERARAGGEAAVITRVYRLPDGRWIDLAGLRGTVVGIEGSQAVLRVWVWGTTIVVPLRVLRRLPEGETQGEAAA